ncbi:hypothetical protein AX16_003446 [Volvariella volvacea WC 439]|nr:hypothetical protein AX16_003446 [Volvariella volvacea WC 439]
MSPTRNAQRPSPQYKPYARGPTSPRSSESSSPCSSPTQSILQDYSPMPYEVNRTLETAYLNGLTPKRQTKALISQALFDRIWDTLHQPDTPSYSSSTPASPVIPAFSRGSGFGLATPNPGNVETPQFRFWVRKMFTIGRTDDPQFQGKPFSQGPPREILLHFQDHLQVAVQEQLYDILCHCHALANHGGRDKTCIVIRKNYAWVPKELVAQFVKACPTCIMKKCGHSDFKTLYQLGQNPESPKLDKDDSGSLPELRNYLQELAAKDAENPEADEDSWRSNDSFDNDIGGSQGQQGYPPSILDRYLSRSPRSSAFSAQSHSSGASVQTTMSHGMSREVSLYQGMPNGWQYHSDYTTARAGFLKERTHSTQSEPIHPTSTTDSTLGRKCGRPRVPSVAPLIFQDRTTARFADQHRTRRNTLPPLQLPDGHQDNEGLPPSLQSLRLSPDSSARNVPAYVKDTNTKADFLSQIDPVLLELSKRPDELRTQAAPTPLMTSTPRMPQYAVTPVSSPANPPASFRPMSAPLVLDLALPRFTETREPKNALNRPELSRTAKIIPIDIPMSAASSASPTNSLLPTPTEEEGKTPDIVTRIDAIHIRGEEKQQVCDIFSEDLVSRGELEFDSDVRVEVQVYPV